METDPSSVLNILRDGIIGDARDNILQPLLKCLQEGGDLQECDAVKQLDHAISELTLVHKSDMQGNGESNGMKGLAEFLCCGESSEIYQESYTLEEAVVVALRRNVKSSEKLQENIQKVSSSFKNFFNRVCRKMGETDENADDVAFEYPGNGKFWDSMKEKENIMRFGQKEVPASRAPKWTTVPSIVELIRRVNDKGQEGLQKITDVFRQYSEDNGLNVLTILATLTASPVVHCRRAGNKWENTTIEPMSNVTPLFIPFEEAGSTKDNRIYSEVSNFVIWGYGIHAPTPVNVKGVNKLAGTERRYVIAQIDNSFFASVIPDNFLGKHLEALLSIETE